MLTEDSKIEFHELRFGTIADEHNLFGVVRWDTDDSLKVDKDLVALVIFLRRGKTIKEAARLMRFSPNVVLSVLSMFEKANFFKSIDGIAVKDHGEKIKPWLVNIPKKWFTWILRKPLIIGILIFSIIGIIVGLFMNGLPSYKNYFWTSDLFAVFVSLFFTDIVLLFLHESCHFLVTKAVGGQALMRVNYRYVFLVAETESYHLVIIPKKKHYYIYVAGIICDLLIVGLLYWFITFTELFHLKIGLVQNFLITVILMEIIGIIWEFNVYLETDLYNFLSEYLDIEFLRNDALKFIYEHITKSKKVFLYPIKSLIRYISKDFVRESDNLRVMNKDTRKKLLLYIYILIGGLVIITFQYIFYTIPRDFTFIYQGLKDSVYAVRTSNIILLSKSIIIITLVAIDYFIFFYLLLKRNKALRKKL